MLPKPSVRSTVIRNGCVMPGVPAVPQNSATSDQPNAARTPSDTSVSIVVVPCRRFVHAARWNGQAPHTTTGAASVSDSHCQYSNCSAGTIAIATTGTVSTADPTSRSSPELSRVRPLAMAESPDSTGRTPDSTGSGSRAAYPAADTVASRSSVLTVSG